MKATTNRRRKLAFAFVSFALFASFLLSSASTHPLSPVVLSDAASDDFDGATYFKTKCAMCHGPKAEKKFNATLPDAELVAAILSGKKGEKPPNMPEYQTKGVTADQAAALVVYMKSLK